MTESPECGCESGDPDFIGMADKLEYIADDLRAFGHRDSLRAIAGRLRKFSLSATGENVGIGVCPKCGVNRFQAACPKGHMAESMGQCPMVGSTSTGGKSE